MSSEIPQTASAEGASFVDPDEIPRPGFWRRVLCWLLDMVILMVAGVAVNILLLGAEIPDIDVPEVEVATPTNIEFVVTATLGFLYFGFMHGCCGKTFGKMIGRFRVTKLDGSRVGFGRAFMRAFWFPGVLALIELPRLLHPEAGFAWVSDVGAMYLLFDGLALVWDQKLGRALHDRLAGTRVAMDIAPAREPA